MWKTNNDGQSLPRVGKAKRRRLRRKKGSQPRLAALGSPFQGKGLAWTLPPSYGRRCPEGAEVGWGKRYEKSGEMHLKCVVYESTLSTAGAVPLPQGGRLRNEDTDIPKRRRLRRKKESQPRLAALGSPFQRKGLAWTLPPSPMGKAAKREHRYLLFAAFFRS